MTAIYFMVFKMQGTWIVHRNNDFNWILSLCNYKWIKGISRWKSVLECISKFSTALKQPPLINPFYYLDLSLS